MVVERVIDRGSDRFICQSCKKQKAALEVKDSVLFPNMKVILCHACIHEQIEPRHLVILAFLDKSAKRRKLAESYISKRKYHGEVISLAETFEK